MSRAYLGVGGTSGPLFGMFFRELSRITLAEEPSLGELTRGFEVGLATVQRYGDAEVGDKTMVDALAPGTRALREGVDSGEEGPVALRRAANAARQGALSAAEITARRGRASYVGDAARGVMDLLRPHIDSQRSSCRTTKNITGQARWCAPPGQADPGQVGLFHQPVDGAAGHPVAVAGQLGVDLAHPA